jgi:hypothetical protein
VGAQGDRRRSDLTAAQSSPSRSAWVPDVVFGAVCIVAVGVLLTIGVEQWFFLDEWDFLSDRTAWSVDDLLRPHNEHWSTIPILVYRGLFRAFGLGTYVPYRAVTVLLHVVCAVLMRMLLRRLGVGPWLSIVVVVPWIFFGAGWQNIVWGFQIGWNGSLALAVAQLLLADHDGGRGRRDVAGLLAGLAALMCSGIAAPLIASVALCLWLKRGWRVALLHAAPLAAVQVLWSAGYGDATFLDATNPSDILRFVGRGLVGTVDAFAWFDGVGLALVAMVVTGLWLRWRATAPPDRKVAFAIPVGLALGAPGYLLLISLGRAGFGLVTATSSRYLHITSYLLLPVVGVAAAELLRRARERPPAIRLAAPVAVGVLLWAGIPGNVDEFSRITMDRALHAGDPALVRATASRVADDDTLPKHGRPLTTAAPDASIGWYQQAIRKGYLDPLTTDDPALTERVLRSLPLVQVGEEFERSGECVPMDEPIALDLQPGDQVTFDAFGVAAEVTDASLGTFTVLFNTLFGETIEATVPMHVVLTNLHEAKEADLCR